MTKKIPLQEAIKYLTQADLVRHWSAFGQAHQCNVKTWKANGDPVNEILFIGWTDPIHDQYMSVKIAEGDNSEVEVNGSRLTFLDTDGDYFTVELIKFNPFLS